MFVFLFVSAHDGTAAAAGSWLEHAVRACSIRLRNSDRQ